MIVFISTFTFWKGLPV